MTVTHVARLRLVFTGVTGTPAYTNWYVEATSVDAGVYQTLMLAAFDAESGLISDMITGEAVNPIPIIEVSSGDVVDVAVGDGGTVLGTASGDLLPREVNGLLQLHTGVYVGGREIRGRTFVPYPVEPSNDGGVPGTSYIAGLADLGDQFNNPDAANGAWVIYSRAHARAEYVSSYTGWSQWASLRSRRD